MLLWNFLTEKKGYPVYIITYSLIPWSFTFWSRFLDWSEHWLFPSWHSHMTIFDINNFSVSVAFPVDVKSLNGLYTGSIILCIYFCENNFPGIKLINNYHDSFFKIAKMTCWISMNCEDEIVSHKLVMNKLFWSSNSKYQLLWQSYLLKKNENHTEKFTWINICSNCIHKSLGVQQGVILGPLLLFIYINYLPNLIDYTCNWSNIYCLWNTYNMI